jgi:polysaccharide biosynthesis transport protein
VSVSHEFYGVEPDEHGLLNRTGFVSSGKRWWWLLLLAALAAGLIAYLVASRIPPAYEAETQLLVGPVSANQDTIKSAAANSQTYAALVTSEPVLTDALRTSGVGLSAGGLRAKTEASGNQSTRILIIRVTDEDPEMAARLAEALATALIGFVRREGSTATATPDASQGTGTTQAETGTTGSGTTPNAVAQPESGLTVLERASVPKASTGAGTKLIVLGAAIAGLLSALLVAVIADSLGTSVRDEEELARLAKVDVLGSIDWVRPARRGDPLVVAATPDSPAAFAYRLLATKVEGATARSPFRTLLVVGTEADDGSGELAANLAAIFGKGEARVTLLDLGRQREVQRLFSLNGSRPAAGEVRRARLHHFGRATLERFRVQGQKGLVLAFPRGDIDEFDRDGVRGLLHSLLDEADLVVVNAQPVDESAQTLVWARVVDATVLVARTGNTNRKKIGPAADSLRMVGANLLGSVLRDARAV